MKKKLLVACAFLALALAVAFVPMGGGATESAGAEYSAGTHMNLDDFSAEAPGRPIDVLFIHHSVGGQLLAPEGPDVETDSIYESFPNGGGLRDQLRAAGYQLHEASYNSRVGDRTDLFDWLPKFRDQMDDVLRVDMQDTQLPEGTLNSVVVFKSCFPNSKFIARGEGEGDPAGPALTLVNAQATMRALLPHFHAQPDTLFLYVTAPPLAPRIHSEPMWKWAARKALGRTWGPEELARSGEIAAEFNRWLTAEDGWLADYDRGNVLVFDYWYILTGEGQSNLLVYPTEDGYDSHPSAEGQRLAAPRFVETLNRAVRRAGIIPDSIVLEAPEPPEPE